MLSNPNKILLLNLKKSLLALLLITLHASTAFGHCQIPCGIYDDHARVKSLLEDAATARKATFEMAVLAGKADPQSANQMVRWVMNKESHAQNIIATIGDYFLTQRVKASQKDYEQRLKDHHAVIVAAMKVKQNADDSYVDALEKAIKKLFAYYAEHKHD